MTSFKPWLALLAVSSAVCLLAWTAPEAGPDEQQVAAAVLGSPRQAALRTVDTHGLLRRDSAQLAPALP